MSGKLRDYAKFHGVRSKLCRDMTIFRFFQDYGRPPSWIYNTCVGTTRKGYLVVFITESMQYF